MRSKLAVPFLGSCLLAFAMFTTGCVIEERTVVTDDPTNEDVAVANAPPADQAEAQTAAPGPNYVWIKGHWKWDARRQSWEWRQGHWEVRRSGYEWVAGHWEHRPNGWVWIGGHWKRV